MKSPQKILPRCCSTTTPHIHSIKQDGTEIVEPINTEYTITFFLRDGFNLPPVIHAPGTVYVPGDVIVHNSSLWHCIKKNSGEPSNDEYWERLADTKNWKERWSPYYKYEAGDIVFAAGDMYECVTGSPAGVHPRDSIYTNALGRWTKLGRVGTKFPDWMEHHTIATFNVDMSKFLTIHSATGGMFWNVEEKFIGTVKQPLAEQHAKIKKLFAGTGESEITHVYTVQSIHYGKKTSAPTDDDPHPEEQNFFGMQLGAYMVPPPGYVVEKESIIDDKKSVVTNGEDNLHSSFTHLMALISPTTGIQYTTIYLQFVADDIPFIAQPVGDNDSILGNMLCLANREPHEKYTELFYRCCRHATFANTIDSSINAFKRGVIDHCVRTGVDIPKQLPFGEYKRWEAAQLLEKAYNIKEAEEAWQNAQGLWVKWLCDLRDDSDKLITECEGIEQDYYGVERWINMKKCDRTVIKWDVTWTEKEGRKLVTKSKKVSLQDVVDSINRINRIWVLFEHCVDGLSAYYLSQIESIINEVRVNLRFYKRKNGKK